MVAVIFDLVMCTKRLVMQIQTTSKTYRANADISLSESNAITDNNHQVTGLKRPF